MRRRPGLWPGRAFPGRRRRGRRAPFGIRLGPNCSRTVPSGARVPHPAPRPTLLGAAVKAEALRPQPPARPGARHRRGAGMRGGAEPRTPDLRSVSRHPPAWVDRQPHRQQVKASLLPRPLCKCTLESDFAFIPPMRSTTGTLSPGRSQLCRLRYTGNSCSGSVVPRSAGSPVCETRR